MIIQRERGVEETLEFRGSTRLRALFVVSRGNGERYNDLAYAFAGDDSVEVVFDRRRLDRRQQSHAGLADRRQSARRTRPIDVALRTLGWAVIRYRR